MTSMAGHNSGEVSDAEKRSGDRMVIVNQLLDVERRMKPLRDERKEIRAKAKAQFKLAEIDAAIRLATMDDQSIFVEEIKELIAIAQAFNALPPGEQGSLFPDRRDSDERSFDAGKVAGLAGKNCEPPAGFDPSRWAEGWHDGQYVVREAIQRDMEARNAAKAKAELIKAGDDEPFGDEDGTAEAA